MELAFCHLLPRDLLVLISLLVMQRRIYLVRVVDVGGSGTQSEFTQLLANHLSRVLRIPPPRFLGIGGHEHGPDLVSSETRERPCRSLGRDKRRKHQRSATRIIGNRRRPLMP